MEAWVSLWKANRPCAAGRIAAVAHLRYHALQADLACVGEHLLALDLKALAKPSTMSGPDTRVTVTRARALARRLLASRVQKRESKLLHRDAAPPR